MSDLESVLQQVSFEFEQKSYEVYKKIQKLLYAHDDDLGLDLAKKHQVDKEFLHDWTNKENPKYVEFFSDYNAQCLLGNVFYTSGTRKNIVTTPAIASALKTDDSGKLLVLTNGKNIEICASYKSKNPSVSVLNISLAFEPEQDAERREVLIKLLEKALQP